MPDIYRQIWDADQASGSGVKAIKKGIAITPALTASGYVIVDETKRERPHQEEQNAALRRDQRCEVQH